MNMKRFLAALTVLAMVFSFLPAGPVQAAEDTSANVLTQENYTSADLVYDQINAALAAPAKKDASQTEKTDAAIEVVTASNSYAEGSLVRSGDSFTWWTEDGIHCVYSPRMRRIQEDITSENGINEAVNEPVAVKGGTPSGNQVYLIGPYYGHDENFTNQYKNEARRVAAAIGDSDGYTLYSGTAATVDKVAEAVSNGAVVFFDSHGMTDYENPNDEYDCITGATNSYLCLTSTTGLTDEDYADGALYYSDGICINGATIANHMTKQSPSGILWMAICLGMGTDTLYKPLREMGVEVVYGYSESVTFDGEYLYEETFWGEMIQGKTVAQSIATMKSTWGNWDWSVPMAEHYGYSDGYATIAEARYDFMAFPVVVSDEDTWPGQRTKSSYGADSLQTVKSTYSLGEVYEVTNPTEPREILEEAYALGAGEELLYTPTLTGTITKVTTAYNAQYGNVTVVMVVEGCEDMPITCYRLQGDGADQITVGDTITVTGTVVNYQHSSGDTEVEFTQGCELVSWVDNTTGSTDEPAAGVLTVEEAVALGQSQAHDTYTANKYSVTGVVTEVYNTTYGNMYITDGKGNTLTIYGTYSADGSVRYDKMTVKPVAGDTVTIYGSVGQYYGEAQIKNGWLIAHTPSGSTPDIPDVPDTPDTPDIPVGDGATLDFSTTDNRTAYSTSEQVWEQNGIKLINSKASSTSDVGDYSNPARFYQGSSLEIQASGMVKIVFACSNTSYANALVKSITAVSGVTVTADGTDVTVELSQASDSYKINAMSAQVRMTGVTVFTAAGGCDHVYASVVTQPTATEQGYTTHTCTLCGDSYVDSYVPALGVNYTVSFAVPAGVDAIASMSCNSSTGIDLPKAGVPAAYSNYTFAGWSVISVTETTAIPQLLTGKYYATADVTLYPVYTYSTASGGSVDFQLVTNPSTLRADMEVIIVSKDTDHALSTTQNGNNRAATAVTKTGNTVTFGDAVAVLQLQAGTAANTFAFYDPANEGYLYAASSEKNYLRTQASVDANASWSITVAADGTATVVAQGSNTRNTVQYNPNNGTPLFSCYASANQQAIVLYARSSGVSYYSSLNAQVGAAANVAVGENTYATVTEALADTSADYITLLKDVEDDLYITSDVTIDLNGCILTADIQIDDGATLYLFDSATADYTADRRGGIIGAVEGNLATTMNTPASYGHNYKYLTIREEDGLFTAHRIYLAVQSVTLVPYAADGTTKVSYKTVFKCSDLVASYVDAYGAQLTGSSTVNAAYDMELAAGTNEATVWLTNTLSTANSNEVNAANALAAPSVSAYIQLGNTVVTSAAVSMSIRDLVVAANAADLTFNQQAALGYMYNLFQPIMDAWTDADITNIKTYGAYWN